MISKVLFISEKHVISKDEKKRGGFMRKEESSGLKGQLVPVCYPIWEFSLLLFCYCCGKAANDSY